EALLGWKGELPGKPAARGAVLAKLLEQIKLVEDHTEELREMIKADVMAHGRQLPIGRTGRALVVRTEVHKHIGYEHGWDVLTGSGADLAELYQAVTISKTAAEKAVKAAASYRQKAYAWKQVWEQLLEAGAITT